MNTTWEFTAVHFGSFFPKVEKLQNGSTHFEWDNGGACGVAVACTSP